MAVPPAAAPLPRPRRTLIGWAGLLALWVGPAQAETRVPEPPPPFTRFFLVPWPIHHVWVAAGRVEFRTHGAPSAFTLAFPGVWSGHRWPAGTRIEHGAVRVDGRTTTCGVSLVGTPDAPLRVSLTSSGALQTEIHAETEVAGVRYAPGVLSFRCRDGVPEVEAGRLARPAVVHGAPLEAGDRFRQVDTPPVRDRLEVVVGAPRPVKGAPAYDLRWEDGALRWFSVEPGVWTIDGWPVAGGTRVGLHPDGALADFTLAEPREVEGWALAAGAVSLDPGGRVVAGTLAAPAEFDGHPIGAGGFRRDLVERRLTAWVTALPETVAGIPVPPGSEVSAGGQGTWFVRFPSPQPVNGTLAASFVVGTDGAVHPQAAPVDLPVELP